MRKRFAIAGTMATVLVAASLVASPATAQLDKNVDKCRGSIAKAFAKLGSSTAKTIGKCHKDRNSAKIADTVDCNDVTAMDTKTQEKLAKAQGKLDKAIQKKCADKLANGEAEQILSRFPGCPEPCATELDISGPFVSFSPLSECLQCLGVRVPEATANTVLGLPAIPSGGLAKDAQKCVAAVAKGYPKYADTLVKGRQKCQKDVDSGKDLAGTPGDLSTCASADPKSKGADALSKANEGLDKSCAGVTLTDLGLCDTSLAGVKSCAASAYGSSGDDLFVDGYEYKPTECPSTLQLLVYAGASDVHDPTETELSVGWTGLTHELDLPDNYQSSLAIDTASCSGSGSPGDCGVCNLSGSAINTETSEQFMRCEGNTRVHCTQPFGVDNENCGGGLCGLYLGGPLAGVSGNTPTCTLNRMAQDATGTVNPDTGEADVTLTLRSKVHQGPNKTAPCPVCGGTCALDPETDCSQDSDCVLTPDNGPCDAGLCDDGFNCKTDADCLGNVGPCHGDTPQDGIQDGVCQGGLADGQPCDIQALNATFGPVSLDCPPLNDANISGIGLNIVLPLSTGTEILPFSNSCDAPIAGESCACGICSGDSDLPCIDSSTCAAAGKGTCTAIGDGVPRAPNGCNDLKGCQAVPGRTDRGECSLKDVCSDDLVTVCATNADCTAPGSHCVEDGPVDTFCDGITWASGKGFISCSNNNDCAPSALGGRNGGSCTLNEVRSCFLNPIVMEGTPGGPGSCNNSAGTGSGDPCSYSSECPWGEICSSPSVGAGTFCLPPTGNSGVNISTGSPGPASVKVALRPTVSR